MQNVRRRSVVLGAFGSTLSAVGGCATAPTERHNGVYHFTMPVDTSGPFLERELSSILNSPVRLQPSIDLGVPGLSPGDIVSAHSTSRSVYLAETYAFRVRSELKLRDFEPDYEVVLDGRRPGLCRIGGDAKLAPDACTLPDRTPGDFAWPLRRMKVPEAWALSNRMGRPAYGQGIVVGHIDTGVASHAELDDAVLVRRGYNFVENREDGADPLTDTRYLDQIGHGTATASVIVSRGYIRQAPTEAGACGGTSDPGRITGTAPLAYLLPVRAVRFAATTKLVRVAKAVEWLIANRDVQIITMALGWPLRSRTLHTQLRAAVEKDIIVVSAAGNFWPGVVHPAADPAAIAVGGTGPDNERWCGSGAGTDVDVSAPGDHVWRAIRTEADRRLDYIGPRFGTSFAVSLTAGVAALWLAHHDRRALIAKLRREHPLRPDRPRIYLQDLFRATLTRTAQRPAGWEKHNGKLGSGIVDAEALLAANPFALI